MVNQINSQNLVSNQSDIKNESESDNLDYNKNDISSWINLTSVDDTYQQNEKIDIKIDIEESEQNN